MPAKSPDANNQHRKPSKQDSQTHKKEKMQKIPSELFSPHNDTRLLKESNKTVELFRNSFVRIKKAYFVISHNVAQ
jgi:hypothetical protein